MHRTTQYAVDVTNNREVTGDLVKKACERHLNDLEKQGTDEFPYVFDEEKANELLDFAENLVIPEGNRKEPLVLEPFQSFILGSLHGWVHKDTGYRRFRNSYVQLARQNGKSILNAIPGLFYGNFDGYNYGQIYITATKQDQAKIVYNEMSKFINADPDLQELFEVKDYKSRINCQLTNGTIDALGRDTKSIDGFRPLVGIVDEYHAHKDNQMYKLLEGGTTNMNESLISVITTAGFDLNSACYELYQYCSNILKGAIDNEAQFVYIAELDEDDDVWNSDNWIKANPLTCKTQKGVDHMKGKAEQARQMDGMELRNFMTKHLNTWVRFSDSQYMDMEKWVNCASDKTLEDFRDSVCYAGLDLSSGGDLTSLALVFPYIQGDDRKYFIHTHSFIPKNRVDEHIKTDAAPYDIWIREGLLTATETMGGIKTDYKYIIQYLTDVIEKYDLELRMICYDPHNASAFLNDIEDLGIDSLSVTQSARSLNDATSDLRLEVEAGNVEYNKDEKLLTWSMANAETDSNSFGEIKINKENQTASKRIDPVDAIIDAWKMAMAGDGETDLNSYILSGGFSF